MEAVYQGASTALVLAGIAVALAGAAVLWWVVGRIRVQNEELALERAACERSAARLQAKLEAERRRMEVLRALVPVAAGVGGHLLGSLLTRRDSTPAWLPAPPPPYAGCTHSPWAPPSTAPVADVDENDDDLTQVELDLDSLLEAAREIGFGDWLAAVFRKARPHGSHEGSAETDPEATAAV